MFLRCPSLFLLNEDQVKKNPFKLPSLLTPDPSASIAQNLVLHGRTLDVSRAVTRDEASKLKEAGERQREKADKRNLYLLREGSAYPSLFSSSLFHLVLELTYSCTTQSSSRTLLRPNLCLQQKLRSAQRRLTRDARCFVQTPPSSSRAPV